GRLNGENGTESTPEYLSGAATRCLTNLVFKYGVDAWICGHDEMYEHSRLTGTETLPDGTTRPHELNVYDIGMGGDGLRGCNRTGRPNPYEVYRAHVDAPEVYDADGTLLSGGKHYGHMEVNVTTNSDGVWTATLTPAYVFVSSNAVTGRISFERRTYPDELVIMSEPSPVPPVEPTCIVKFNANGGSVSPKMRIVTKGKAVGSLPKATKKGYTLKGWYTKKKSGGSKVKTSTKVKKDVTYYARWKANKYKIKFNKNGGKGKMKTQSTTYGKKVTLRANAFKRSKYKFKGWAKTKKGKVKYKNKAKVKNLTSKNGKTVKLYAVWKKTKSGNIKAEAMAADVSLATSVAVGKAVKVSANAAAAPSWPVGTFYGGDEEAFTTITVSMAGKVSGKVLFAADTWTIVGKVNGQLIDAVVTDASGNSAEVVFAFVKLEDGRIRIESEDGSIWAE
ncbi:MAG: InlB B-repeat-containing protein, partial [Kiritimatiellae bacterium]|nr:InlB B-repeat-containing protein [Kiritimatiellia bacterium]